MSKTYIKRQIEPLLKSSAEEFPVLVLTGPRQSGKSTVLKTIFSSWNYVTLDDPVLRNQCREDPGLFLENYKPPCIIDEIQYAPMLLPYIKIKVDENRSESGQYLLTGSQIFPLISGVSESLAGRAALFELHCFNQTEYKIESDNIDSLFKRIYTGSYPDPLIHKVNREIFLRSYIQTYLERDIRQVENVQDLSLFQNLLELLASRVGCLLNLSEISKSIGVSQTSVKRWVSLLENSRIIYLLRPYSKNIKKRIVKSPKIYFLDTGLLSYLLRYPDYKTLMAGPMNGAILENHILCELHKQSINRNEQDSLYFFRDSNQNEIDIIIDKGYKQILCEIKLSKSIKEKHYTTLLKQKDLFSNPELVLLSAYEKNIMIDKLVQNRPIWEEWYPI